MIGISASSLEQPELDFFSFGQFHARSAGFYAHSIKGTCLGHPSQDDTVADDGSAPLRGAHLRGLRMTM
jgi:hypothetical protein